MRLVAPVWHGAGAASRWPVLHSATTPPEVAIWLPGLPKTCGALLTHGRRTRARLLRVQRAIGVYEELACAAAMPPELRPPLPRRPALSRGALGELDRMLLEVLAEIDAAVAGWHAERRN
jgi:hypothetical protein